MNPGPLHIAVKVLSEVHMNTSHVMLVKAGFGCEIKSSSSHLYSLCSPLLLFPSGACVSGADGGRQEASVAEEEPFPLHRAGTGVICHTINIFMNTIKVLTSSYMRFRVMREMYFTSEENEPHFIVFHSKNQNQKIISTINC